MLKRLIQSMSWKNVISSTRLRLKMILVIPIFKLTFDYYDTHIRAKQARIYRSSTVFSTVRNPSNPPLPVYCQNTWEAQENLLLRNKIQYQIAYQPEDGYYFATDKDFPVRQNEDYIDYVIHYAMYNKTKHFNYLIHAKKMEDRGGEMGNMNQYIREIDSYKFEQLESVLIPKL